MHRGGGRTEEGRTHRGGGTHRGNGNSRKNMEPSAHSLPMAGQVSTHTAGPGTLPAAPTLQPRQPRVPQECTRTILFCQSSLVISSLPRSQTMSPNIGPCAVHQGPASPPQWNSHGSSYGCESQKP